MTDQTKNDRERFVRAGKKRAQGADMRELGKKGAAGRDMAALGAAGGLAPHASRTTGRNKVPKPCRRCGVMCESARAAWSHCAGQPKKKSGPKPKAKDAGEVVE